MNQFLLHFRLNSSDNVRPRADGKDSLRMRFEYYHAGLEDVPKLSVDGLVPGSVHFSHWQGNETPAAVKADSSTEIALNVVASPARAELTQGLELVTNNHFDTDGVLSVWTMLAGERALGLRDAPLAKLSSDRSICAHSSCQRCS